MKIQEIEKAQEKWGKGIVKIGELKDSLKECRMFTIDFINKMAGMSVLETHLNGVVF